MVLTDYWKVLVFKFSEIENTVFFEPESWWKDDLYWLLKRSCFELSGDGKYSLFLSQKKWCKDDIYWLLKSSYFELFGDGKYGLLFSQEIDGKMIFTWSVWAFQDISGLAKYGLSCSVSKGFYILSFGKYNVFITINPFWFMVSPRSKTNFVFDIVYTKPVYSWTLQLFIRFLV